MRNIYVSYEKTDTYYLFTDSEGNKMYMPATSVILVDDESGAIAVKNIATRKTVGLVIDGQPVPPRPQYRWVDDGWTCKGFDKWQQMKQQESTDSGATWHDTGVVSATSLIEADSEDCGYIPPVTGNYLTFRAVEDGTFSFTDSIDYSLDSGATWTALAVNTQTPTISAGDTIMWKRNVAQPTPTPTPSRLPSGYTEVEYIENPTGAYIDTGIHLNASDFEVGSTFNDRMIQWGYVHQGKPTGAWVTVASDYAYFGRYDSNKVAVSSYLRDDENTVIMTQSGVTVNGTFVQKDLELSGVDDLSTVPLFASAWYDFNRAGAELYNTSKIKGFYVKNNGTLVRDLVPCIRDDGKVGMYDLVSSQFFTSPNGKDFTTKSIDVNNGTFSSTARYEVEGNIMSMIFGDDFEGKTYLTGYNNAFKGLFKGNTHLTSAEKLSLPATTLSDSCYMNMFNGCTSLSKMPQVLPAKTLAPRCYWGMFFKCGITGITDGYMAVTTLADHCCQEMFAECSGLTYVPIDFLPVTTLENGCYVGIFRYTNIRVAPTLPATVVKNDCYYAMFRDCHNLEVAPELPANKMESYCYYEMFKGCSKINYIKCLATESIGANGSTSNWVQGVAATGTFIKAAGASWSTGNNGVPRNWNVEEQQ